MTFLWPNRPLKDLVTALATRGPLRRVGRRTFTRSYLDTFDGRLYAAGWTLTLVEEPAGRFLEGRDLLGALRCRVAAGEVPSFAEELPAGGLAEALGPEITPRRLLTQATVEVRATRFEALDDREKTVARFHVERRRARFPGNRQAHGLPARVVVEALRGFEDAAIERAAACGELGLEPMTADELTEVLARVDRRPGEDPARLALRLDAAGSAGDAVVHIHTALLAVLRATEDGVRQEFDPEFLHDYRVALRRTRSLLGQLPGVFDEEATERFRRDLGRLARETGPARDLDVFLAELTQEVADEPALRRDLAPVIALVGRHRRRAGRRLRQVLEGPRTARVLSDWQAFLATPTFGPAAAQPVRALFGEALERARARLLRRGSRLDAGSAPEDYHRLRIDAKKLRYVLETGASLWDKEDVAKRLAPLKALQELLGGAQDLAVREARLIDAAAELATTAGPAALVAIGRLVERAHRRRFELYQEFPDAFAGFASPAEQKRWSRLLRPSR
ncbi:MAG: CHAD domain-containing protein [Thermoanaerobaculia bacterium]|nr:CHAD domain-containing protein [Thermoanaerobaculia bacterium]